MKISSKLTVVIALLSCLLLPFSASAASPKGHGQLVVKRAANFGLNLGVDVWVDGEKVTRLQYGQTYTASLSSGQHDVRIAVTARRHSDPVNVRLNVAPGKTYQLTAAWDGQVLVLR